MDEFMTSFGIPIVSNVEGGTMEELKKAIPEKIQKMKLNKVELQEKNIAKKNKQDVSWWKEVTTWNQQEL